MNFAVMLLIILKLVNSGFAEGKGDGMIRLAIIEDASRVAEILIFSKRMNYRKIFKNDKVSLKK